MAFFCLAAVATVAAVGIRVRTKRRRRAASYGALDVTKPVDIGGKSVWGMKKPRALELSLHFRLLLSQPSLAWMWGAPWQSSYTSSRPSAPGKWT
eukprot:43934-Eustigmatos_ZCMA.PRE.1